MKILYLNHVCWEWIFQRPQIIALKLEQDFDCTVINKMFILGKIVAHDNREPKKRRNVWLLPKGEQFKVINSVNRVIYRFRVRRIANQYDAIWVCHPSVCEGIPSNYKGWVIYDCMDNHVALTDEENKSRLQKLERQLLTRADLVFVSSKQLKETLTGVENATLVRNGFLSDSPPMPIKPTKEKEKYKIGYFGTISSWFDFDLLQYSLKHLDCIEYHVIGPVSSDVCDTSIIDPNRIILEGTVEHKKLPEKTMDYDALIMPFIVNDIILSVDPVKLYEYINLGKCVISVKYPEIERFEPFVYFYQSREEYIDLIERLSKNGFIPKYTEKQRTQFLEENSWDARYKTIKSKVMGLTNGKK